MNPLAPSPSANTPYKILRLYLKGATVEVPHMANLPQQAMSPQVGVDMQTEATPAGPGALECVLRVSMHARLEGQNVFMIEVSEAGVFELDLSNMEEAHRFVRQIAPSVLFPFARRDLANLAVSAGFQPVLLDHVDFDALLTQVIKSQRRTRVSAPMRVDVIAAKPAMPTVPAPLQEVQEVQATQEEVATPLPAAPPAPVTEPELKKRWRPRVSLLSLLALASTGAMVAWWLEPNTTPVAPAPVIAVQQPKVVATPPVVVVPQETQMALVASRERLAEQPKGWFTLDLGAVPASTPLNALTPMLPEDRPLFVLTAQDGTLRVLYGVFPSHAIAELLRGQLQRPESLLGQKAATVVAIGSL